MMLFRVNKESTVSEPVNDASLMTEDNMDTVHLTTETSSTTETTATTETITITSTATTVTSSSNAVMEEEVDSLIDLGAVVREANGSWDKLRSLVQHLPDDKKKQYLSHHFKPSNGDTLHSHPVTKKGRTWKVSFQQHWLLEFTWLSYSHLLSGGICRHCILFPEQPERGDGLGQGNRSGTSILAAYQHPYSKALGKDGVLVSHSKSIMHVRATERVDLFLRNFCHSNERIDSRLLQQGNHLAAENKHILTQIVLSVEFLAKQGLPFRGHRDDKIRIEAIS